MVGHSSKMLDEPIENASVRPERVGLIESLGLRQITLRQMQRRRARFFAGMFESLHPKLAAFHIVVLAALRFERLRCGLARLLPPPFYHNRPPFSTTCASHLQAGKSQANLLK